MNNIWEKLMNAIKDVLAKKYRLDMDGTDERLAYLVYAAMMGEKGVRKSPNQLVKEAYELAPIDYWRKTRVSFSIFQRSIYRTLHRAFDGDQPIELDFFKAINAFIEQVKM